MNVRFSALDTGARGRDRRFGVLHLGFEIARVEFRKELPKSNVGKILRRELRDGRA